MSHSRREPTATLPSGGRVASWRRAFGLRTALSTLVVSTVACTALVIHLSWSWTARQNVAEIVGQLNAQIAGSVRREVQGLVAETLALQETVRSIFAHGALMTTEPEKRAVLLLSLLRWQPGVSWVSLGLPDGGFVGAQKQGEHEVDLVEVDRRATPVLHVDHYAAVSDGMALRTRETSPSDYDARTEEWFRRAVDENGAAWTQLPHSAEQRAQRHRDGDPALHRQRSCRRRQHRHRGRPAVPLPQRRPHRPHRQRRHPRSERLCRGLARTPRRFGCRRETRRRRSGLSRHATACSASPPVTSRVPASR